MRKVENDVARHFCTKENLPVAKEVADKLLHAAMESKNTKRVRELSALVDVIESAIEDAGTPPPATASASAEAPEPKYEKPSPRGGAAK